MWLIVVAAIIIIAVISVLVGSKKDDKIAGSLKSYLGSMGFIATGEVEVFDKDNQGKPFRFLIDRQNKKWTLTNYRATVANVYDYTDLIDYSVTYRTLGTDMLKGEEHTVRASECNNNGIIASCNLKGDNCEYIEIRVVYTGKAQRENICSHFILFEKQRSFLNAQNNDFHVPTVCVNNAGIFEGMLWEIVSDNK